VNIGSAAQEVEDGGTQRWRWKTEAHRAGGGGSRPGRCLGGVMEITDHSPVRSQASTSSGGISRRRNRNDLLNGTDMTNQLDLDSF